jgi:putative AdoMet-dependent methyltransferase
MERSDWYYDDLKQVGTDFADSDEVATYDERQSSAASEDRTLLAKLGLKASDTLADIGCGTGILVCEAAKLCHTIHAVDVSKPMLAATARRAAASGLANVTLQHAGFLSFTLPEASVDLVTTKFALHHLPDQWKGVALDRMAKALKPGATLFIGSPGCWRIPAMTAPPSPVICAMSTRPMAGSWKGSSSRRASISYRRNIRMVSMPITSP